LPTFPVLPQQQILVEAAQRTGNGTFTTDSLTSTSVTVQVGCVGSATASISVRIYQGSSTPIFQISRQPCDGDTQKVTFTAEGLSSMTVKAQVPSGSRYSLMMVQG
jgi:hypothetical protein